jgi:hypothetical protein
VECGFPSLSSTGTGFLESQKAERWEASVLHKLSQNSFPQTLLSSFFFICIYWHKKQLVKIQVGLLYSFSTGGNSDKYN